MEPSDNFLFIFFAMFVLYLQCYLICGRMKIAMKCFLRSIFFLISILWAFMLSLPQSAYGEFQPLIDDTDKSLTFDVGAVFLKFIPLGKLEDGSVYGVSSLIPDEDEDDEIGEDEEVAEVSMYVVCEKSEGVSDVYLVDVDLVALFAHITLQYEGKQMILEIEGSKKITADISFRLLKNMGDVQKDVGSALKELEEYDDIYAMLQGVSKAYREGGASMVRMTYGKTFWETAFSKQSKNDKKQASPKKKKKSSKKSEKPKLDKNGCIAYVNEPNLVKVVSKRIEPTSTGYQWSCKVKNKSANTVVRSCYVAVKMLDKKGFELADAIEDVNRIEPGATRIISGTIRVTPDKKKKLKRTEFHVDVYAL